MHTYMHTNNTHTCPSLRNTTKLYAHTCIHTIIHIRVHLSVDYYTTPNTQFLSVREKLAGNSRETRGKLAKEFSSSPVALCVLCMYVYIYILYVCMYYTICGPVSIYYMHGCIQFISRSLMRPVYVCIYYMHGCIVLYVCTDLQAIPRTYFICHTCNKIYIYIYIYNTILCMCVFAGNPKNILHLSYM